MIEVFKIVNVKLYYDLDCVPHLGPTAKLVL